MPNGTTVKSRKQRTLENLIRRIAHEVAYEVASKVALRTALREISAYDYEKSKPTVIKANDLMRLFDHSLFPESKPKTEQEAKEDNERKRKHVEQMYKNIGVPYDTPLYYGKGMKLMVYPEHMLPTNYTNLNKSHAD